MRFNGLKQPAPTQRAAASSGASSGLSNQRQLLLPYIYISPACPNLLPHNPQNTYVRAGSHIPLLPVLRQLQLLEVPPIGLDGGLDYLGLLRRLLRRDEELGLGAVEEEEAEEHAEERPHQAHPDVLDVLHDVAHKGGRRVSHKVTSPL